MKEVKTVINVSLQGFMFEVQKLIQEGWEIDVNNPPCTWGVAYETGMTKTDKSAVQLLQRVQAIVDGKPKMSVEQRMEKARAARGTNKSTQQDT